MSVLPPRPASVTALALLALLPAPAAAQLGYFGDRPALTKRAEQVRQTLMQFGLVPDGQNPAQKDLDRLVKELSGVKELGQVLVLPEWRGMAPPGEKPAGPTGRNEVARKFKEALGKALEGDAARQCAAATLFAEMTVADQQGPWRGQGPDPFVAEVLADQLGKVAGLAKSKDAGVREAVARALGRTALDPTAVVEPLAKLLGDKEPEVRRVAAMALVRQARSGDPPPGELGPRWRRHEIDLAACAAVVPAAAKGLADKDDEVSRDCALAVKQAAATFNGALHNVELQVGREALPIRPGPGQPGPGGAPLSAPGLPPEFRPAAKALGEAVESLRPLLKSPEAKRRLQACQALEGIATAHARTLRLGGDGAARVRAPGGKPFKPEETSEPALLAGLSKAVPDLAVCVDGDKDLEVRLAALYVLEDLGPDAEKAAPAAAEAMKHDDPFVRWGAARVLGKMAPKGAKDGVPALARRVNDPNGDVRITVLAALKQYGPAALDAVKEVSGAVNADDEQTRLWAVRVLAAVGKDGREQTTEALTVALSPKETSAPVRRAAVAALAAFGKPDAKATAALRAALADADPEVRRTAGEALLADE
jgi:HEAT repeat protein